MISTMSTTSPKAFSFNRGDRVVFKRGMFGYWAGSVRRTYTSRRTFGHYDRIPVAEVAFTRRNGTVGTRVVAVSNLLIPVTETMAIDTRGGVVEIAPGVVDTDPALR